MIPERVARRSFKAPCHRQALPNRYHVLALNVRLLYGNSLMVNMRFTRTHLDLDLQPPPSFPMALTGCSHFTINGGISLAVGGDQHNNNQVQENLLRVTEGSTALAQFHELKVANIRLKQKIAENPVVIVDSTRGWIKETTLDARRTIHAVSIRGEDKDEEFLHVQYSGPDALRAYEHDFKTFSAIKDVNWVELFGYTSYDALPALVFYDALVPVSHIFEQNGFSSMLRFYLCYSAIMQGVDARTLFRELWVNPRNGTFHKGLYVADSSNIAYRVWPWSPPSSDHPSLDLQTYNNTSLLFQYLIGILPVRDIIYGIIRCSRRTQEWADNQDAKVILSSLPGTVYHRTCREVIAQYPGDREQWYYYPWQDYFHIPDAMRENTLVMDDGSVRFMLQPADIAGLESFELYYDFQPAGVWNSFVDSWVSQAHGIFSQLGIEEGEWVKYSILGYFYLKFTREQDEEGPHTPTDIPPTTQIYLFIQPVPRPSNNENRWDHWLGGRMYYWSHDSAGKEEMSEGERRRLGLPLFRTSIEVWHLWWDRDIHNAIEMVNRHQGFDPTSMDLARSLGKTILEVVGDRRFEEVKDDDEEVEDVVNIPGNSGSGSVGVETPKDAPSSALVPTMDVHPRPPFQLPEIVGSTAGGEVCSTLWTSKAEVVVLDILVLLLIMFLRCFYDVLCCVILFLFAQLS